MAVVTALSFISHSYS